MKNRLLLCLVITLSLALNLSARNYYVAASGNNNNSGLTEAAAWQTIAKVNSYFSNIAPGDSILFKRGDTFFGSLIIGKSGTNALPIVIDAYGTGAKPVISGFINVPTWVSVGNGVYQSLVTGAKNALNMVTINNVPQALGRYPNSTDANGGYLSYETFAGTTSITDNQMTSSTNWVGAELVVRKKLWVLDRCKVNTQTGGTFTFTNITTSPVETGSEGFGYFIQNDPRTLDKFGEWYFNPTTKYLQVYFGSASPSSYTIKASGIDTLLYIGSKNYINIKNIAFDGPNGDAILAKSCSYINIQNCDFTNSGSYALNIQAVSNLLIENCNTNNILSNGIFIWNSKTTNVTIRGCSIKNTGLLPGMGLSAGGSYKAIYAYVSSNLLIESNRIDTSGYVGIEFQGSNVTVKNNVVNYYDFVKDDAGGIYSYASGTDANPGVVFTNRVVNNNIVMNGIGAPYGRTSQEKMYVSGIYLDGRSMNVSILNNTIFNIGKNGIHCNNPSGITVRGNTCYNTLNAMSIMRWASIGVLGAVTIKNNIFYPKLEAQRNFYYTNNGIDNPIANTVNGTIAALGNIDSNYYSNINQSGFNFEFYGGNVGTASPYSLDAWRAAGAHDINGKKVAKLPLPYKINSLVGANKFSNGAFTSTVSGVTVFGTGTTGTWDNTGKINGGSIMVAFSSPAGARYSLLHAPMGAISSAKKYLLRFSTYGTTQQGIVRGYIRKTASPYSALTSVQSRSFVIGRKDHEFLFNAPTTDAGGSFVIEIEQNSGTTYIDNIEFYEVDATLYDFNSQIRFEYNDTKIARAIALDSRYTGVDGTTYTGSVTLQPFTSLILVRDTGAMALSATVANTVIKCYNDSATVTVTATGGTAPYTGTGTFKVIAGTYTYTVRDAAGATSSSTITITRPAAPLAATANAGTISVAGGTTTIAVSATGGTAPYSGTGTFTVSAGTYTYTVSDANGCTSSITKTVSNGPVSYTLSVTTSPTAGGTVTGAGTYTAGATATLTATPAAGYVFTGWSGGATGTAATITVAMTANKSLTATFAIATTTYVLTVTTSPTAGGTVTGAGTYTSGTTASLTATPAAGYTFAGWSGAVSGTATTVTVAMTANRTVTATFTPITYTLTVVKTPVDGGTVTGAGAYTSGATATLTATPLAGYTFTGWSGAATGTATSITVPMTANKSVTATFSVITTTAYTLTTVASPTAGGTVTGAGNYATGTRVSIAATPATGYAFTGWSGATTGTVTPNSVLMNGNKTVTASFAPINYTLTATATPTAGGTVTGGGTYAYGSTATLTAVPAAGYTFTGWTGAAAGTAATTTVSITGNLSAAATFAQITYTLTATASPTAGGTVTGAGIYTSGTTATLTATPAAGYTFSGWSGAVTGTATTATVSMTANKSVTATFTAIATTYTLTATASPTAGGTVTGAGIYTSGATATLTATPAAGYTFSGWSGAVTGTATTATVSMTANKSVTATFSRITYILTATASPTVGGTVTGAGTYTSGITATLTATPAAGYTFSGWSGAVTGTATTVTVSMTANKSVTATFTAVPTFALITIASPTIGGIITGAGNYTSGATASVTATPAAGYRFTGWSGAITGTATTQAVLMNANKSVTANFAVATTTFTLTASASPTAGGTVTGAGTYTSGATATLTAIPAAGYTFTGWSGAVTGTNPVVTVSMTANKSVTAAFAANTTIRIEDDLLGTNGLCSIEGTVSNNSGANNSRSINLTNSLAKGLDWNVNAGLTGTYNLKWRYANGSTSNTFYMKLIINGVAVEDSVPFPKTLGSSTFLTTTGNFTLQAGHNTVRLESIEARATADIDWMEVTGYNPAANNCLAARAAAASAATTSSLEKKATGVYPNPAAGRINIGFTVPETQTIAFVILDAAGNPIARTKGQIYPAGYNIQQYDMSGKAPGIYAVLATGDKNFKVAYKFVVIQ